MTTILEQLLSAPGSLAQVPVHRIRKNPDNPRIFFRQEELEELQDSIRQFGVQVPITVYKQGNDFILIDGERRWRCASKLNHKTIPALVQKEPGPLKNLLLMFNIHALREQWDTLTIALKLTSIIDLLGKELGRPPTEADLSQFTGLSRGRIRRCRLLIGLPKKYRNVIYAELEKPQSKQAVGEDFFIEMEKALKSVSRAMPDAIPDMNTARDALLAKYRAKVIESNIEFRKLGKIARATALGTDRKTAQAAIQKVINEPRYSISQAWDETVSDAYTEHDVIVRVDQLISKLEGIRSVEDEELRERLEELADRLRALLGDASG